MKNTIYILISLVVAACGADTRSTVAYEMVPKCSAFVFTTADNTVSHFSDSRVKKACKNGQEFRGLYVVESINGGSPATLCGFWVIDRKLVTLDFEEMPAVDMSQYSVCE